MQQYMIPAAQLVPRPDQVITPSLYDRFVSYIDASEKTVQTYSRALRQFFKWIRREEITQPLREDVIRYRDELKTDHKPATVQNYIFAVRQFFRWTAQEGIYPNIADRIKGAKVSTKHKKDALTIEQAQEILALQKAKNTPTGIRDYALIAAAVTSGLRTVEIQRANIEDLRQIGNRVVLNVQGKGEEDRADYVLITKPVEKAIRRYLRLREDIGDKAPLFASVSRRNPEGRMTTRSISRIIKNAFREAGYDSSRLTAHTLRHTAGTINLLAGGTLQETQQLLRHMNINTTTIYAHNLNKLESMNEERITAALFTEEAGLISGEDEDE